MARLTGLEPATSQLQVVDSSCTGIHAVANYKQSEALRITFRVSRFPAKTLGQRIRKRRLEMGLKQVEWADLLGVHEMTIVNWETGKTKPSGRRLRQVNRFLNGEISKRRLIGIESRAS